MSARTKERGKIGQRKGTKKKKKKGEKEERHEGREGSVEKMMRQWRTS